MNYLIFGIICIAVLIGILLVFANLKKYKICNMQLEKLDNTDIPCGAAFKYLKLSNSIGEAQNDSK